MPRFKDTRENKTREERTLDKIEKMIESYKDNCAGPYWSNRSFNRSLQSHKKKRYRLTEDDRERLEEQKALEEQRLARRSDQS